MKKLAIAAAVTTAFTGAAHAYTMGTFNNGFVVPNVYYDSNEYTAVGVINNGDPVNVYWTFFDQDSNHITDGCFTMTRNDYEPFIWNDKTGGYGTSGQRGYLVFVARQINTAGLAAFPTKCNPTLETGASGSVNGNAFQVLPSRNDVAYVPVIDGTVNLTPGVDVTRLGPDDVISVAGAASGNNTFYLRYFIDGTPNNATSGVDTRIVVWSTGGQAYYRDGAGNKVKYFHTVNIYDDKQNRKSVNFDLAKDELDWFDPETIVGRPADFTDGFIEWTPNTSIPTTSSTRINSVFSYSVISAATFGATQTILNPHTR